MLEFIENEPGIYSCKRYHSSRHETLTYIVARYDAASISGWYGRVMREDDIIAKYEATTNFDEVVRWAEGIANDIDAGKMLA